MRVGDRVRVTHSVLSDKSDARYVDRFGTVVIVKHEVPSSVAVLIDGEARWYAFALRQLEAAPDAAEE
jgi:hypothetical protein